MKKLFLIIAIAGICSFRLFAQNPADNFGFKATPNFGSIKVLTILWQYNDTELFPANYNTTYSRLVFGNSDPANEDQPSLGGKFGFYDQISNGNFNFINAGVIGPISATDIADTRADERMYSQINLTYGDHFFRACQAAETRGFNFRQFDSNNDGTISRTELCINIIHSNRYQHEFISTTDAGNWGIAELPSVRQGENLYSEHGYSFVRNLGYVYPSSSLPVLPETIPLNFWFKSTTGDNYSTTIGNAPLGYSSAGVHGFIFRNSFSGTIPVNTFYNELRKDYLLTTTTYDQSPAPGYSFVRQEGFIFDPILPQPAGTVPLYLWEGNGTIGGGQQRPMIYFRMASGLQILTNFLSVGQDCINTLSVLGHEMVHYVGGLDIYGAGVQKNYRYSLFGSLQQGKRLSHPDPMNKIMAGWIEPIANIIGTSGTFDILATEISKNSKRKAYVFWDPNRPSGNKEFFILEYRHRTQWRDTSNLRPLFNLWDRGNQDNHATTSCDNVLFDSRIIQQRYHKIEGFIFHPSHSQPDRTVPLYSWYNPTISDGFTTTNSAWSSSSIGEMRDGYRFQEMLGYIYDPALTQPENTLPLYLWYSPSRQDNFITADQSWAGTPGVTRRGPDYTCVRLEGYIKQGTVFNYDGASFSNLNGIPDDGLAIWYVKIGDNGLPINISPARDRNGNPIVGGSDAAVYILPQNRSYGFSENLFKHSDGLINVNWPDGSSSGLRIEILTTDLNDPILRVRTR